MAVFDRAITTAISLVSCWRSVRSRTCRGWRVGTGNGGIGAPSTWNEPPGTMIGFGLWIDWCCCSGNKKNTREVTRWRDNRTNAIIEKMIKKNMRVVKVVYLKGIELAGESYIEGIYYRK